MRAKTLYANGTERFFSAPEPDYFLSDGLMASRLHIKLPGGQLVEYESDTEGIDTTQWLLLNQRTDERPVAIMLLPDSGGRWIYRFRRVVPSSTHFALAS